MRRSTNGGFDDVDRAVSGASSSKGYINDVDLAGRRKCDEHVCHVRSSMNDFNDGKLMQNLRDTSH